MYGVKVSGGPCRLAFYPVLPQIAAQCMLSIDQWSHTSELNAGVSVVRLLTYSLFSAVCAPDDFFTVSDSYSV